MRILKSLLSVLLLGFSFSVIAAPVVGDAAPDFELMGSDGKMLYSETLEGYFGEEMNLASKLGEDIAEGGETLLTVAAYENADRELVKSFEKLSLSISGIVATYYMQQFNSQAT